MSPLALNDAPVSIPADRDDGHGGHEQRKNFAGREAAAEPGGVGAEGPLLEQKLPQGDGHREEAEKQVRQGQGHHEVVVCGSHRRFAQNCNL